MRYLNTNKGYVRNLRLWHKRGKPMHPETLKEIEEQNEAICRQCKYCKSLKGELVCTATDRQWDTDKTIPCITKEDDNGNN